MFFFKHFFIRRAFRFLKKKSTFFCIAWIDDGIAAPERVERFLLCLASVVIRIRRPIVIGITGSVGKSTATEAIFQALEGAVLQGRHFRVRATRDNMNNHDGLPLTVLGFNSWQKRTWQRLMLWWKAPLRAAWCLLDPYYPDILVLEYGSDRSGYLRPMVMAVPPRITVISNIGHAHLAGMGGPEGVFTEKLTLFEAVPLPIGFVIGEGHPYVQALIEHSPNAILAKGSGETLADSIAGHVVRLLGVEHVVPKMIQRPGRRLERIDLGWCLLIDDSFNANPTSIRLALEQLDACRCMGGRRVAFLGTMAELGDYSERMHAEVGALARSHADLVVSVGQEAEKYCAHVHFPDSAICAAALGVLLSPRDIVLVKGSASMKMQRISNRLRAVVNHEQLYSVDIGLLQDSLLELASSFKGTASIAVLDMESRQNALVNHKLKLPLASLTKICLCVEVLRNVEQGKMSLDDKAGTILGTSVEDKTCLDQSVQALISKTLIESDNDSADVLFTLLGGVRSIRVVKEFGLESGFRIDRKYRELISDFDRSYDVFLLDRRDQGAAIAVAEFLALLYKGSLLGKEHTEFLIDCLCRCETGSDRLRAHLPNTVSLANKTGTLGPIVNDAGLLMYGAAAPLAIVVLSVGESWDQGSAARLCAEVANRSWMVLRDFSLIPKRQ